MTSNKALRGLALHLPETLSILINVIAEEWGRGVFLYCVSVCVSVEREAGGVKSGGETDKRQCEEEKKDADEDTEYGTGKTLIGRSRGVGAGI